MAVFVVAVAVVLVLSMRAPVRVRAGRRRGR
jgi:hypothetical protein